MKIKIIPENKEKISNEISHSEGKATERLLNFNRLNDEFLPTIEEFCSSILFKKDWIGLRFKCRAYSGKLPSSYKWMAYETIATIQRFKSGWFLVSCGRATLAQRNGHIDCLNLETKKESILQKLTRSAIDAKGG